jgi:hypothetical protein
MNASSATNRVTLSVVTVLLVILVSLVYSIDLFPRFGGLFGASPSSPLSPFSCFTSKMTDTITLANNYFDVWNTHDGTAVGQLFAPEGTLRDWDVFVKGMIMIGIRVGARVEEGGAHIGHA